MGSRRRVMEVLRTKNEQQPGASNAHRRQCAERRSSAREGAIALDRDRTESPFCAILRNIPLVFLASTLAHVHLSSHLFHSSFTTLFLSFSLSLCLYVAQGPGSYVHVGPRPCFEHLSMGQACNPPTQETTLNVYPVLSCPPHVSHRQRDWAVAHAAGNGHFLSASTSRRSDPYV